MQKLIIRLSNAALLICIQIAINAVWIFTALTHHSAEPEWIRFSLLVSNVAALVLILLTIRVLVKVRK